MDQWSSNVFGPPFAWDTASVEVFDQVSRQVTPFMWQDIDEGILPALYGATSPDAKGGAQLAERVRTAVATVAATTAKPWLRGLRLSIGYAATAEGVPVELLVPMADNRLYEDKRRTR